MHCHPLEDGVIFLDLQTVRRVFFILGGNIPGSSGHTRLLMLCAFQYYLYSVAFFCHGAITLASYLMSIPFAFASLSTAEIPFLLIAFRARVETLSVTDRSSSGI